MQQNAPYPIGSAGQQWGQIDKAAWLNQQVIQRSYQDEVVNRLLALPLTFELEQYGTLNYAQLNRSNTQDYPLYLLKNNHWDQHKPTVLITGGVHGYETSGVQGAISFVESKAQRYTQYFNILVAPCVSPWGYETINRWNPAAIDPNRSFITDSPAPESAALMDYISAHQLSILVHIDLHETTDTDNSEFRPALAARDGIRHSNWNIPDGFYLVGDSLNPVNNFQKSIIESVQRVTHIAPADTQGQLIGVPLSQFGVINYATKALGLCSGFTDPRYSTTTEVYPDSPNVDARNCINAQVMAITAALDYLVDNHLR